uniref:Uncharacterized protein n=1 Tax=Sphaerodactylus townsendi TaxID=933632 RepID=A0ACB8ERR0_9SAUR
MWFRWCVAICLVEVVCSDPEIIQQKSLILQEDEAAHMKCEQRKGHQAMYWYRQDAGQALQMLFAFQANSLMHTGNNPERFKAEQFSTKYSQLNISHVKREDSAVYFCASSQDTALQSHQLFLQKPLQLERASSFSAPVAMRWKMLLGLSVGLQLLAGLCRAVTVTQKERFMILKMEAKASIPCEHDDSTYLTILWYRQKSHSEERQMQLIGYSVQGNDPVMEMNKTKFAINRLSQLSASLIISATQLEDTAGYFCAASKDTVRTLCLTVLHKHPGISHPSV